MSMISTRSADVSKYSHCFDTLSSGAATRVGGGNLDPQAGDLAVTAGWGHAGQGGVTMPGKGKILLRSYTPEEGAAIEQRAEALGLSAEEALAQLGDQAVDVYLNDVAYWRCVSAGVWSYRLGGYQVMKKWLSYREKALLGRDLKPEEVRVFDNLKLDHLEAV
ncbi:MAG: hypothetical protein JXA57_05010 [Armatimonadetes bacterium]|nr:hypothetical protein [Armatimonadota bacterium]